MMRLNSASWLNGRLGAQSERSSRARRRTGSHAAATDADFAEVGARPKLLDIEERATGGLQAALRLSRSERVIATVAVTLAVS